MPIALVMPSNHLIFCCPPLLTPSIFPSIRVFSNESALHIRWPKYWIFSFNISPSSEYSGLISFRMDWLDVFAVQGTLKSLLQYHTTVQKYQFIAKPVMKYIILIDSDVCMHICGVLSHSVLSNSATPWTVVHQVPMSMGILQTRILEWVAMPSSRESSQPRD